MADEDTKTDAVVDALLALCKIPRRKEVIARLKALQIYIGELIVQIEGH